MKNFKLVACAAAVAAFASGSVFAAADMDSGSEITNAGIYVNETVLNVAGTTLTRGADADQTANVSLGASFATDAVAYVRFDLPAGVTFVGAPDYDILDNVAAPAVVSVAQGGAGSSFVIFAVAPSGVGNNLVGANIGTFVTGTGVSVPDNTTVALQYRMFETLTNAANEALPLKTASEASFVAFANAIAVVPGVAGAEVADVAAAGGAYTAFVGASLEEPVVFFSVTHTPRALVGTGVNTAAAGDVLGDTNSITITGDFTAAAANGVTLGANCVIALSTGAVAVDGLSATFTGVTAATIAQPLRVCYAVNGTDQIVASSYSGTVDLVADAGFSVTDGVTGVGEITRNGTVLKAAFGETPAGTFSGTVNLTNTGSNNAPFTTSCLTTTGRVAGNAGSITANSAARFGIGSAAGLNCPANTRGLELTFAVPTGNVIGSVVRQDATTGQAAFDGMVGNQ
jgi:hypothetical protein